MHPTSPEILRETSGRNPEGQMLIKASEFVRNNAKN